MNRRTDLHARRIRRLLAATASAGILTAACATPQPPPSELRVTGGAEGKTGDVSVREVLLAYRPSAGDVLYRPGETVDIHATITNEGAETDRLLSVSSSVAATVTVDGDTAMPGHHTLATRYPREPAYRSPPTQTSAISMRLTDLRELITAGLNYTVVFTFARAGAVRLDVPVDTPGAARPDCPLPPNGKQRRTLTAPLGAPAPPAPPLPYCSSLQ